MIFGTHLALDNSDHVLDGGPNPPLRGVLQNVPRHVPVGHLSTSWALVHKTWSANYTLLYYLTVELHFFCQFVGVCDLLSPWSCFYQFFFCCTICTYHKIQRITINNDGPSDGQLKPKQTNDLQSSVKLTCWACTGCRLCSKHINVLIKFLEWS